MFSLKNEERLRTLSNVEKYNSLKEGLLNFNSQSNKLGYDIFFAYKNNGENNFTAPIISYNFKYDFTFNLDKKFKNLKHENDYKKQECENSYKTLIQIKEKYGLNNINIKNQCKDTTEYQLQYKVNVSQKL